MNFPVVGFSERIAVALTLFLASHPGFSADLAKPSPLGSCPNLELKETLADCPWSSIARAAAKKTTESELSELLLHHAPSVIADLKNLKETPEILQLWGSSINYDEFAKGTIVQPELLDLILKQAGAAPRTDRIVHAGLEHTYGYLFSTLATPYGYKRARWVQPDIETGLALAPGTLSPSPSAGTFLGNVTAFAAQIALADHPELSRILGSASVHPALKKLPASVLNRTRLTEIFAVSPNRSIELRTDFVTFSRRTEGSTQASVLIYSVREIQDGTPLNPVLITLFPVAHDFMSKALNPENLGEGKPIITRYNAYISGASGSATPWTGSRKVTQLP